MVLCLPSRLCITHSEPFLLFPESVQVAVCHHKLVISHIPFLLPQNTIPLHYMMFTLPLPPLPSQQSGSQPSSHVPHPQVLLSTALQTLEAQRSLLSILHLLYSPAPTATQQGKDRSHHHAPAPNPHVVGFPPKKRRPELHTGSEKLKSIYHQHLKKSLYDKKS